MTKPSAELAALFAPVLDWLDAGGDDQYGFDMRQHIFLPHEDTDPACGTTCCIAGAMGLFVEGLNWTGIDVDLENRWARATHSEYALARNHGMSKHDMDAMFYNGWGATPAQAAAVIRHWIETGDIEWAQFDHLSPKRMGRLA